MFSYKLLVQVLFGILVIFTVQGYAAPISFHEREESSKLSDPHISGMDSPLLPWHRPKESSIHKVHIRVIKTLNSHMKEQDNGINSLSSNAHAENRSLIDTHLILVITLSILAPCVLCLALYPIFRRYRNRKRALQAANETASIENADQSFEEKDPDTSSSEDSNQSHLEALPAQLVYVPPTPQNGTQPLFGHFLSPCGQVLGVKDTWKLAGSGDGKNSSADSILVHEV